MRHRLANVLYGWAARLDRPSMNDCDEYPTVKFGNPRKYRADVEMGTVQFHLQDDSFVDSTFKPGQYTYAALHVGDPGVTLFLNRKVTKRLIHALTEVDRRYTRFGEARA